MIDVNKLEALKTKIETLNKFHQVEILKILSKNLCKLNENKSGIFINMSFLEEDVVEELTKYVDYIDDQNETFQTIEYQKEMADRLHLPFPVVSDMNFEFQRALNLPTF